MTLTHKLNASDPSSTTILLLGNYRPTLRLAQTYHGMGYKVVVTRGCGGGYASFSRYVAETWDHPPLEFEAEFYEALGVFLRSRPDIKIVLPLWERCIKTLARFRHILPDDLLYVSADPKTVETCLDKSTMLPLAGACSIPNADFTEVDSYITLIGATHSIGFPLVVRPGNTQHTIAGKKTLIAGSGKDLMKKLPAWPDGHERLITQKFVDGPRINLYFAAQRGKPIRYLATEILKTDELDGTGLAVEGITIPLDDDIKKYGDGLIKRLKYHGIGTLQFIRDRTTSEAVFLELNPRIAGNHAVPEACGLELGKLALELARGEDQPDDLIVGQAGKRYTWTYGALSGLYNSARSGDLPLSDLPVRFWNLLFSALRTDIHMTWTWRDPVPTLMAFANHIPIVSRHIRAALKTRRPGYLTRKRFVDGAAE